MVPYLPGFVCYSWSLNRTIWRSWKAIQDILGKVITRYYLECHGDLVRHSLLKYWDEVGRSWDEVRTKLVRSLTIAVRCLSKFLRNTIPQWSNIDPLWPNTPLGGASRRREVYLLTYGLYLITSGLYFVENSTKIVPQSANFVTTSSQ